jgi:membrane protein implicated in regulation of membrane protease activity
MKIVLQAIGAIALLVGACFLLISLALLASVSLVPESLAAGVAGGIGFSVGFSAILVAIFFFSFASVLGFLGRIARATETVERITKAGSQHPKRQAMYEGVNYWVYEDDRVLADMNGTHQQFANERELLALLRARRAEEQRAARPAPAARSAPAARQARPEAPAPRPRAARS